MRKIKKYFIIILLSIFTLTTVETSSLNFSAYIVQAKVSSSTKRKAQEAYRKFLTQRRYRYFTLWDIDKDGLKELLVTDGRERVGNSPIKAYAYTYTRGKLRYAGDGNVIYDNSELNADNCRIDFDIDVSGIRELSFEYNGICDMTDILFGMSDAKLCS